MQCMYMKDIWSIDKKTIKNLAIKDSWEHSSSKELQRLTNKIMKYRSWELGVEQYFTGKQWNFYCKTPSGVSPKQREQYLLYKLGYYKHNKVGCGTCEICRTEASKQWAVKAAAEAKVWKNASFLTLTYNEPNLQVNNGFINKADMQTFWKKLRYHLYKNTKKAKKIDMKIEYENMENIPKEIKNKYLITKRKPRNKPLRYIQCNEYGTKKGRAHAHAVVFNFKPADLRRHSRDRRGYYLYTSKKINSIWGHGYVIIADTNANVAAYVARYNTKKFSNTSGTVNETYRAVREAWLQWQDNENLTNCLKVWKRRRESISASSLGYIGSYYWEIAKDKIMKAGGIFVQWAKGVHLEKLPKPMQKQMEWEYPDEYEIYDVEKCERGKKEWKYILSKTTLSEQEYIKMTYEQRMKKLKLLKRDYDEKPTVQTIYENR